MTTPNWTPDVPLYDRRCTECGETDTDVYEAMATTGPIPCRCGGHKRRVLCAVGTTSDLDTHYNVSVGRTVRNRRDFRDALKAKSEEASLRTGIVHDFQEVDRRDTSTLGVTDEGLDSTARVRHAQGAPMTMPD